MNALGLLYLAYSVAHGAMCVNQLRCQYFTPALKTTKAFSGPFVRLGNAFFAFMLVCNNLQLFAGSIAAPGMASKDLFYICDTVHLIFLPLYAPMGVELLIQASRLPETALSRQIFARLSGWLRAAAAILAAVASVLGIIAFAKTVNSPLVVETNLVGMAWAPATTDDGPPASVLVAALASIAVGAGCWYIIGYRVLFVLQMIETLGQGAGGAAGRGYVVVVSNFFEVVFVLSFVLAERRIFGEEAGTSSSSGRKEEPLLSGTT